MLFINEFNKITNGKYLGIMPSQVAVNIGLRTVNIELLVPYEKYDELDTAVKTEIFAAARKLIPMSFELNVTYKKFFIDSKTALAKFFEFLTKYYPSIPIDGIDADAHVVDGKVHITVGVAKLFAGSIKEEDFSERLINFLHTKFTNEVTVDYYVNDKDIDLKVSIEETVEEFYIKRRIRTLNHSKLTGKDIIADPSYISDRPETDDNAVYCGKIDTFKQNFSQKTGNPYYVFYINDNTGRLMCKAFSKTATSEYSKLFDGDTVIVQGKLVLDTFAHDTVLLVNSLSKCEIDYDSIVNKTEYKKAPKFYEFVHPKTIADCKQVDIFGESTVPASLRGKEFVIFDTETTGLIPSTDRLIEIGAVRMVNGVITESFSTLINPGVELPDKIIEITGIKDADLIGAPTIDEVFPDFYKFIGGASLVAHNAAFDMGFICRIGEELKYKVDNKSYDTIDLARQVIPSRDYKLATLCKVLGIVNHGAHRALNDVLATTDLFVEAVRRGDAKGVKMV